ncbi:hypothetical protein C9374_001942 [Naegleria lovaniensis]|uniref:Ankyrin repeat domain-containing protein n=1 Tax=Naegleria lovaniensis TaxID=51637 RepID=A0AA88KQZ7_NAELO|nr:uncharacterized protein C9374_001942 [Naegleria lovaniensis]KAG2386907.1 hypothetical protein C9374_001942 [Naegleria lovaniensis]
MKRSVRTEDILAFEGACRRGETQTVKELLESVVEVDRTVLVNCSKYETYNPPIMFALWTNRNDIFRYLLKEGYVDVNAQDTKVRLLLLLLRNFLKITIQNTLLHVACIKGNLEAVSLLVQYNCDTTLKDITGKTACDLAEQRGHLKLMTVIRGKDFAKKLHHSLQKHLHKITSLTDIFFQALD